MVRTAVMSKPLSREIHYAKALPHKLKRSDGSQLPLGIKPDKCVATTPYDPISVGGGGKQ